MHPTLFGTCCHLSHRCVFHHPRWRWWYVVCGVWCPVVETKGTCSHLTHIFLNVLIINSRLYSLYILYIDYILTKNEYIYEICCGLPWWVWVLRQVATLLPVPILITGPMEKNHGYTPTHAAH